MHINTLPAEVLAHIFELGTASPENDFGQDGFPDLVSLVCKPWHTLSLSAPTLWTTLTLEHPPFRKTQAHIARSKHAPLNIYLDFSARPELDLVRQLMAVLLPELSRWRHLVLVVPAFDVMYAAVRIIADAFTHTPAPYLEILRLYGPPEFNPTEPEPHTLPSPIPLFGPNSHPDLDPTPRLRDVVLCGVPVDWSAFSPTTLERLQLSLHSGSRRPTFAQFARLTTSSPALHTLILNASGPALPLPDEPRVVIDLAKLKSLTLDCFDPEHVEGLLKRVCTPRLEVLALADAAGDSSRVFEMLAIGGRTGAGADGIGRSASGASSASVDSLSSTASSSRTVFPRLTTLKISSVECTPAAFRQLVRGLPNLTNVKLDARDADPAVLGMMAGEDNDEVSGEGDGAGEAAQVASLDNDSDDRPRLERICPQLRTITCTGVPGSVIRDFVARRLKARVPVRTVRVCVAPEDDEEEQEAEDEGDDRVGHWLSAADRTWLDEHVELEFFDEDEDEEIEGGAWWSTWD